MLCNPWLKDQCNKCSRAMGYCINPRLNQWHGKERRRKKKGRRGRDGEKERERGESYYDLVLYLVI